MPGTDKTSVPSVSEIFDNMEYGPAPESTHVVEEWINKHSKLFGIFINGRWEHPEGRNTYDTKNPATGDLLATTIQSTEEDVDKAVLNANAAYKKWSALSGHQRAKHLYSIARHIQKHSRLFELVESLDNGKPFRESRDADIPAVVRHFYHHAGWAQLADTEMAGWHSLGVVGAIVPWNFPLMLLTWKLCPALAMGNTVVLKPATYTRLSALLLAEVCSEAGLPPGVFNVVTGKGTIGSCLAMHPLVSKVAFTGSTEIGQILRRTTAGSGKRISLELGGKSPVIVFDSCDLDSTVEGIVNAIWFNQGQVCSAGSRLLVQETIITQLINKLKNRMKTLRVGQGQDKAIDMGALVDKTQLDSITAYVEQAKGEGAEVYQACEMVKVGSGGEDSENGRALFYPPTLVTRVNTSSRIVSDEVFGPVLVVLPFRTAREAITLGNNTVYGLAASVWTENVGLALEVALSLKAGTVWVNTHNVFDAASGFGGYRQSGYGRDGGKEGLYEYVRPTWTTHTDNKQKDKAADTDITEFITTVPLPVLKQANEELNMSIDHTYKMYYGGSQKRPDANYTRPIYKNDGTVMSHVGEGNRKDIRNAVEAANKALPGWSKRAAHNRAQICYYLAENLQLRRREFADRIAALTGTTYELACVEVDAAMDRLFHWAAYSDKHGGTVQETTLYGATIRINEPVGVLGIVCPDKYPLLSFVSLLAPAIVRGNCVVIIPSERFPILALDLYQVFDTSDVPAGVINIITGDRESLAVLLAKHQDVQSVWYHGPSAKTAKDVEYYSAENLKRTWVFHGTQRDWLDRKQGAGTDEFLYHATQVKNIWIPMGEIYAN